MLFLFFRIYEILSDFSGRPPATAAVGPSEGQKICGGQFITNVLLKFNFSEKAAQFDEISIFVLKLLYK